MPLPVIPDTVRVAFEWSGPDGLTATNVMHFEGSGVGAAGLVIADIVTTMDQGLWGAVHSDARITMLRAQPLDGVSAVLEFPTPVGVVWQGFAGGEAMLPIAQVITLRTGLAGRRNRGRVFLPFIGSTAYDNGVIEPSVSAAVQTEWTNWLAALETAGSPMLVASYGGVPPSTWPPFSNEVSTVTAQPVAGTQRRRQDQLR